MQNYANFKTLNVCMHASMVKGQCHVYVRFAHHANIGTPYRYVASVSLAHKWKINT